MPRPGRVLGYARVSSEEQARGTSLRDQQEAIRAHAKASGLAVTAFYIEAESGIREKEEHREQMQLLLRDVRVGDLVLCDKLDRWSRDAEFTYRSVRQILGAGASFYAVSDRCDPSTSEGDTALGFRILFAREEHKRIKERMVGTRNILRNQGYYAAGAAPLGYRRASPKGSKGLAKNVLVIVPEEAKIVRSIYRLYISGKSMAKVADALGLKLDRVKDVLDRRVYLGEVQTAPSRAGAKDGQWIKGHHEAIIDADMFVRARAIIDKRRRGGPRSDSIAETSTWILRDVARCGRCGAKAGAAYAGPKTDKRRYYYMCSHHCRTKGNRATNGSFTPVRAAEAAFSPLFLARLGELRDELAKGEAPRKLQTAPDIAALRDKLQRRRDKYLEAFADDMMTGAELRAAMTKLDAERLRLDAREQSAGTPRPLANPQVRREVLKSLRELAHAWGSLDPSQAREIVNLLVRSVGLQAGCLPVPVWAPLETLTDAGSPLRLETSAVE